MLGEGFRFFGKKHNLRDSAKYWLTLPFRLSHPKPMEA